MAGKQYGDPIMTIRIPQKLRDMLKKETRGIWSEGALVRSAIEDFLIRRGYDLKTGKKADDA